MDTGTIFSIGAVIIALLTLVLGRIDKAKSTSKENHQELIEYQIREIKEDYKNIASDIKDIKKMLDTYKETFRNMIKDEMEEHVKTYHKEVK